MDAFFSPEFYNHYVRQPTPGNIPSHVDAYNNPKRTYISDKYLGALDGTHIKASVPAIDASKSRRSNSSLASRLLVLADSSGRFTRMPQVGPEANRPSARFVRLTEAESKEALLCNQNHDVGEIASTMVVKLIPSLHRYLDRSELQDVNHVVFEGPVSVPEGNENDAESAMQLIPSINVLLTKLLIDRQSHLFNNTLIKIETLHYLK